VTSVPAEPEVGLRVIAGVVTAKLSLALLAPAVAVTVFGPAAADEGTVKVAEKLPAAVVVIVAGVVAMEVPLKVTATCVFAG
jgi:hypothetical protein